MPRSEQKGHLRQSVVACFSAQKELPDEFEHAKPDLRLKLWPRAAIEKTNLRQLVEGDSETLDLPLDDVGQHLYASVVYDLPHSVRSISNEDLENWGVTVYEAMEVAKQNLTEDNFAFASIGDRLYSSMTGDSYDSSRLLLIDWIQQLQVEGDPVAMVPSRDTLLITGSDDEEGLSMLLELTEKSLEDPRPMLFMPLRLDGDAWVDWMPPKSHPLYDRFRLLEVKYLHPEYEEQKTLLEALFEKEGRDLFVADYTAAQREDDSVFTYSVWPKGVDTLLPKTQMLILFDPETEATYGGDWDEVAAVVGDLMEETDYYPPRFRVWEFPSEEQLKAIGSLDQ